MVVRLKIIEGFHRLYLEHPEVSFAISTDEVRRLEDELNTAMTKFERDECDLTVVRAAWTGWTDAVMAANEPRVLFQI
jgi:hypothetical protein